MKNSPEYKKNLSMNVWPTYSYSPASSFVPPHKPHDVLDFSILFPFCFWNNEHNSNGIRVFCPSLLFANLFLSSKYITLIHFVPGRMSSFIKFFDSTGFLIALSSLDGVIKYTTQAGKEALQLLNPAGMVGQNISLVLKVPQLLDSFRFPPSCASSDAPFTPPSLQIIELETIHNTCITAHVSPNNTPAASPKYAREAFSPNNFACQAPPSRDKHSPSSLAQAFQYQQQQQQSCQFHGGVNVDHTHTGEDEEEEMSFNECFENAAVECK
jgi:hypothetical protein